MYESSRTSTPHGGGCTPAADGGLRDAGDDGRRCSRPEAIAASYISPNDRLSSFERLEIYNRQYWFRLISAVSEDFPTLNAVLGTKRFDALILAYLEENPSTSWTLRDLGAKLPAFLKHIRSSAAGAIVLLLTSRNWSGRMSMRSMESTSIHWRPKRRKPSGRNRNFPCSRICSYSNLRIRSTTLCWR